MEYPQGCVLYHRGVSHPLTYYLSHLPYPSTIPLPPYHQTKSVHLQEKAGYFYLVESGILHAHYSLPVGRYHESIVAGTTCGELPFFSSSARTATVSAERDCVCWRLGSEAWERMNEEWPEGSRELLGVALKLTKERVDAVTSYVLTTAG